MLLTLSARTGRSGRAGGADSLAGPRHGEARQRRARQEHTRAAPREVLQITDEAIRPALLQAGSHLMTAVGYLAHHSRGARIGLAARAHVPQLIRQPAYVLRQALRLGLGLVLELTTQLSHHVTRLGRGLVSHSCRLFLRGPGHLGGLLAHQPGAFRRLVLSCLCHRRRPALVRAARALEVAQSSSWSIEAIGCLAPVAYPYRSHVPLVFGGH
ncbi:hypothetical protein [Streptomyces sp. NPDC003006]